MKQPNKKTGLLPVEVKYYTDEIPLVALRLAEIQGSAIIEVEGELYRITPVKEETNETTK